MKTSQLIDSLVQSMDDFGDVDVNLMDSETGNYAPVQTLIKLHPFTGSHGCMNREKPVNALALMPCRNNAKDLILALREESDESK